VAKWDCISTPEVVNLAKLEKVFNPEEFLTSVGPSVDHLMEDLRWLVQFFKRDPELKYFDEEQMVQQYKIYVQRIFEKQRQFKAEWFDDDHQWLPLRVIESLKDPTTGLCKRIPMLSHLAGIAGVIEPASADTERLVKEHKRIVKFRFTRGYNETHVAEGLPDHSAEELFNNQLKREEAEEAETRNKVQEGRSRLRRGSGIVPTDPNPTNATGREKTDIRGPTRNWHHWA